MGRAGVWAGRERAHRHTQRTGRIPAYAAAGQSGRHTRDTRRLFQNTALVAGFSPIVLVLRSPLEDLLSAKRVQRRVRAFVVLAIAAFLAGGIAAKSLWSAAHAPSPPTAPVRDAVGTPQRPADGTPPPSAAPSHRRPEHRASRHRTHAKPADSHPDSSK
jgi:hypothetical protein